MQLDGHPDLHFRNGGQDGPDARLIAAAPDLAEALDWLLACIETKDADHADRLQLAIAGGRNALKKALGK